MTVQSGLRRYLLRVVRRPWPWILRYVLALLPALAVALLLMVPLRGWFRLPVAIEALETRSLELLFDAMRTSPAQSPVDGLLWLLGLLAIPLIWAALRLVWLWLEGAVLTTYVADDPPTPRAFLRAGFHRLGSFLLIWLLVTVGMVAILGVTILLMLLARQIWPPLTAVIGGIGGFLVVLLPIFGELARAGSVAWNDRHVLRAFRHAGTLLYRSFLPLLGLIIGTLLVSFLLFIVQRQLTLAIPLSWWAATLIVQQVIQIAITGVGLLRRAGEVGLAVRARELNH
jgi:hypothetical protein